MAWHLSTAELVDEVASGRDRVQERRSWRTLESLARGLRWVDQLDESRRLFHEAAGDVIERIELHDSPLHRAAVERAGGVAS